MIQPIIVCIAPIAGVPEHVELPAAPVYNASFTPDARILATTRVNADGTSEIVCFEEREGEWAPADFFNGALAGRDAGDGAFSPDGDSFYFVQDQDIHVSRRADGAWAAPVRLPLPVNTPAFEAYPRPNEDGSICMTSNAGGDWGIYIVEPDAGGWHAPVALPSPINSALREHDAMLTPCGNAVLFVRRDDPAGAGATDIFLSVRSETGWSDPEPAPFNSPSIDGSPCLTPDLEWLYFTSNRPAPASTRSKFALWRLRTSEWPALHTVLSRRSHPGDE